ncbi:sigma-70 family RNA polymerase sigma factor [Streptomyces sp. NBC_01483]|uniref:sigma-70 family RNA polymerase sigma factor n=1 Tax=Streptomyces sp. NBC_01483 TaxID=2903883 RepID=UPI002E37A40C|nr:sigma-70 family RNA polymerase sigma factor [Streptomyces sp. NBC_01483]
MREYRDGLVSYAEKMLGDHGVAEDIVQETIIRAWRNMDRLLGMEGPVKGWLFTVTRNLIVDWVRKPHMRREVVGGVPLWVSSRELRCVSVSGKAAWRDA